MSPESKQRHLEQLDRDIRLKQERLASIEHARNTADSPMTSRYDTQREIFAQDANVARELLERTSKFRDFVSGTGPMSRIDLGAEFTVELLDADETIERAIYAPFSVKLVNTMVIIPSSPLGSSLKGLTSGDAFTYNMGRNIFAGIVKAVS